MCSENHFICHLASLAQALVENDVLRYTDQVYDPSRFHLVEEAIAKLSSRPEGVYPRIQFATTTGHYIAELGPINDDSDSQRISASR